MSTLDKASLGFALDPSHSFSLYLCFRTRKDLRTCGTQLHLGGGTLPLVSIHCSFINYSTATPCSSEYKRPHFLFQTPVACAHIRASPTPFLSLSCTPC